MKQHDIYETQVRMSVVMQAISDLLDYCDRTGEDFETMLRTGRDFYLKETGKQVEKTL